MNSGYINDCGLESKKYKELYKSIACAGNPELFYKLFNIPKQNFINHVLKRRSEDVNVDLDKLYDVMKDNFANAKTYYRDFSTFRIFRCFNVGKTNFNNKPDLCDYVQVVSVKDNPNTMITCYFINDPGSLSYYDITGQVFKDELVKNESDLPVKHNIEKFNQRQKTQLRLFFLRNNRNQQNHNNQNNRKNCSGKKACLKIVAENLRNISNYSGTCGAS